jgi:hypothetical protein
LPLAVEMLPAQLNAMENGIPSNKGSGQQGFEFY